MIVAARLAAAAAVILAAAPAAASPWPEPERPINQPSSFLDVDAAFHSDGGYDTAPSTTGAGLWAGWTAGAGRPLWLRATGLLVQPFDDGPRPFHGEVLVGRSVWMTDCAQPAAGGYAVPRPVRSSNGRILRYQLMPVAAHPGTFVLHRDLVIAGGLRTVMMAGANPDGSHTGALILPELGVWYGQSHHWLDAPGRLHIGVVVGHEFGLSATGVFGDLELTVRRRIHLGIHGGGVSGTSGARELTASVGAEL